VSQRWKLAVIGILAVGATSLASTLTTAYLMRPPAPAASALEPVEPPAAEPAPRPPIVRVAPPRHHAGAAHKPAPSRPHADGVVSAP